MLVCPPKIYGYQPQVSLVDNYALVDFRAVETWLSERKFVEGKWRRGHDLCSPALPATATAITSSLFTDKAEGVALLDTSGKVLRANAQFYLLTGAKEGLATREITLDLPEIGLELRRSLSSRNSTTTMITRASKSLRLSMTPVANKGVLLWVSDRSREQELELQLGRAKAFEQNAIAVEEVQHDINNILAVIQGAADDLTRRAADRPGDLADLRVVTNGTRQTAALLGNLTASAANHDVCADSISVNDFLRNSVGLIERLLDSRIKLDLQLDYQSTARARLRWHELEQIVTNLVVNARHAMPNGGSLIVRSSSRELQCPLETVNSVVPVGHYVCIRIEDTGDGISREDKPYIFKRSFTTRRAKGGEGLGLFNVLGIVSRSGGHIDVQSAPGKGTRFDVYFPSDGHECLRPGFTVETDKERTASILLVDDDHKVRNYVESALARVGWQVFTASCAEEALDLVDYRSIGHSISGVLSDLTMPGMDGLSLIRKLRSSRPSLPAVLMSGYHDRRLGVCGGSESIGILIKPFLLANLNSVVEDHFKGVGCSGDNATSLIETPFALS